MMCCPLTQQTRGSVINALYIKKAPHLGGAFQKAFRLFANDADEFTVVFAFHFKLNFTVS
jgi:hypothetical protein